MPRAPGPPLTTFDTFPGPGDTLEPEAVLEVGEQGGPLVS